MIVTLDGGTTNTRLYAFEGEKLVERLSSPVGSNRKDNAPLREAVADMVKTLSRHGKIEKIIASGMVTSELGLYELPHIPAPAGIGELAAGAVEVTLPFCEIPFVFIPGVKTGMDMMRGEETECMGLGLTEPCAIVLPGTHNKVIAYDGERITDFMTMMSGETIAAVKNHTILSQSLPETLPDTFDPAWLQEGAAMSRQYGVTGAFFRVRSLDKFGSLTTEQLCSFFVGAVLENDARAVSVFAGDRPVFVGGKEPLRAELCSLIPNAQPLPASTMASAMGALKIYQTK